MTVNSKIIAYLRISTNEQDLKNQKFELLEYSHKNNFKIDEFVEMEISSRKTPNERKINFLIEKLQKGDLLIVSELSRLGRSVGQVIQIIDSLIKKKSNSLPLKKISKLMASKIFKLKL